MGEDTVVRFRNPDSVRDALTELLREGAGRLLRQAVQSEVDELLEEHAEKRDAQGRAAVVRNGHLPERQVLTGIGPVAVRCRRRAAAWMSRWCFARAMAVPARDFDRRDGRGAVGVGGRCSEVLVGARGEPDEAKWQAEHRRWCERRLDADRWVYLWVDGIYSGLRGRTSGCACWWRWA